MIGSNNLVASEGTSTATTTVQTEEETALTSENLAPSSPASESNAEAELTDAIKADVPTANVILTESDNTVHVIFETYGGARVHTKSILKAVKSSSLGATLRIDALANLRDKYGNSYAETVLRVLYLPETVEKIDPENIRNEHVWDVADEAFVHPVLAW